MAADELQHLLRRAGFGASTDDLTAFGNLSYAQAVDRLVDYELLPDDVDSHIGAAGYVGTTSNGPFSPNTVITDARQRWLFRMLHSQRPLQEKMALFWHNYFATGFSKIASVVQPANAVRLLAAKASDDAHGQRGQIDLFRAHALASVRKLIGSVAIDPAMLIWLDGDTNTKARPQENFGRELMELFSRGVGYYTESDVYAAARVFTGWNLKIVGDIKDASSASFTFVYNADQHETSAKTFSFPIYADGATTIPARSASHGMQDGVDLISALASHPETARRIAQKLYAFFVSEIDTPDEAFIAQLASTYLENDTEMRPVIRMLLNAPQFRDPAHYFARYSWPVEFVVRAMKEAGWDGFSLASALSPLASMGQQLFDPPDVAGWALGANWFSTGAMLARMNFAATLASNQKFKLAAAASGSRQSPDAAVAYVLGRMTPAASDNIMRALLSYASAGVGTPWTGSDAQLQAKAAGLVHLVLGSPEYQFL